MPDLYKGKIPIIRRDLNEGFLRSSDVPDTLATGAVPRDYDDDPVLMGDSPAGLTLFSEQESRAAFQQQEADESSLEHLYLRGDKPAFEFLDQGSFPDCWVHSTAHAMMFDRLKQGLPVLRFNAVAGATLMNRTNGGWSGLSMKFTREQGLPVIGDGPGEWPYQSRRGRDTPELRANMALHKVAEDWYDLGKREYDQTLTRQQLITLGSSNVPCPVDYNRFGHAMLMVRAVLIGDTWSPMILNSWKGFGYYGLAVLFDMWPDNAVALRSSTPSVR